MICLNSAGNLVRSEVGNQNTKDTDGRKSASSVGLHWGGRAASEGTTSLATSEPCRFAGRQDGRPRAPGTFPPLVDPPPGGGGAAVCTWSHGAPSSPLLLLLLPPRKEESRRRRRRRRRRCESSAAPGQSLPGDG